MSLIFRLPFLQRVVPERLASASAIVAAVALVREPSVPRHAAVAFRLLAVARADRYAITNFYLPGVMYLWRDPDGGLRAPSVAEAATNDDGASFKLTNNGAVIAEWNGAAARALITLGTFAGAREDSPFGSPDDRFDFEFAESELELA